jgi:hypothetical protein
MTHEARTSELGLPRYCTTDTHTYTVPYAFVLLYFATTGQSCSSVKCELRSPPPIVCQAAGEVVDLTLEDRLTGASDYDGGLFGLVNFLLELFRCLVHNTRVPREMGQGGENEH